MIPDEFIEVVAPMAPELADAAFKEWIATTRPTLGRPDDDAIRIDTIRGPEHQTLKRYLVTRRALEERC